MKTDDARDFWFKKRIEDLDTLRAVSAPTTYIVIDCEGNERSRDGVTSIGVAFLPSIVCAQPPKGPPFEVWPWEDVDLDAAVRCFDIRALSSRIGGRHRASVPEPFRYGYVGTIPSSGLEDYLCQHLKPEQERQKRLVFVAWGIDTEMQAMASLFPSLFSILDGWIDIGKVASDMARAATTGTGEPAKLRLRSLKDTLLALGFSQDNYSVPTWRPHDPGMDAVRTAAALVGLMLCPSPEFDIPFKTRQPNRQKRPCRKQYPYAIRISTEDGSPMPRALNTADKLNTFMTTHFTAPTAFALCPQSKKKGVKKTHGWVCFDSTLTMERCVQELNGFRVSGVSLYLYMDGSSPASPNPGSPRAAAEKPEIDMPELALLAINGHQIDDSS